MFSFLIRHEVNDDAVKLKTFCDSVIKRYLGLDGTELLRAIERDFPAERRYIDSRECSFVFEEIPEFIFHVDGNFAAGPHLLIQGRGKYQGFMLQFMMNNETWICSARHGIVTAATGGARKLVKVMCRKYDIDDFGKMMRQSGMAGY